MKALIGIIIVLAIFVFQLWSLPYSGVTWDEPLGFFIGRANLKFWQTGNRQYLTDLMNKKLYSDAPIWYTYGPDTLGELYPPFSYVVASAVSFVLSDRLHLVPPVFGFRVGELLFGALGIGAFYIITVEIGLPLIAAVGATLAFALYPTIIGQMRSDAKDIPLMSLVTLTMALALVWVRLWQKQEHHKGLLVGVLAAISFGASLATKPTAALMGPILLVWFLVAYNESRSFYRKTGSLIPILVACVVLGIVAIMAFLFLWPWLWDDPVGKLTHVWTYFKDAGFHMPVLYMGKAYRAGISLPQWYPLGMILFQTPIELTVLASIGSLYAFYRLARKDDPVPILFVLWFWMGIVRFFLPGVIIYAKIRHFIEVMPAFFVLVGYGIQSLGELTTLRISHLRYLRHLGRLKKLKVDRLRKPVMIGIVAVVIAHEMWIIKTFFPYEPSYFNILVGGTKTVSEKHLFDAEYWGSSVKEAVEFISKDAKGAPVTVYPCLMSHLVKFAATANIKPTQDSALANYVIVPHSPSWFGGAMWYYTTQHTTLYTVTRAGAPLFYVFKPAFTVGWRCGTERISTYEYDALY